MAKKTPEKPMIFRGDMSKDVCIISVIRRRDGKYVKGSSRSTTLYGADPKDVLRKIEAALRTAPADPAAMALPAT